jgi:hypothetical protein
MNKRDETVDKCVRDARADLLASVMYSINCDRCGTGVDLRRSGRKLVGECETCGAEYEEEA